MGEPGFWDKQQAAQGVVQQVKTLRSWIEPFESLDARVTSSIELEEMLADAWAWKEAHPTGYERPSGDADVSPGPMPKPVAAGASS